jgi:undecaprenyl diphosphate synthase
MPNIPKHIAIIMDGNGRWAATNGLPRAEGHRRGAERIEAIIEACKNRGIKYITLYAFSEENWMRPGVEVIALMHLLRHFLVSKRQGMVERGVRFRAIGDIARLPSELQQDIKETERMTASCRDITMVVALSYGGRHEICRACNSLLAKGVKDATPELFAAELDTNGMPDPDLLIRTSGEYRISNFLLWQLAYAELYFTETLWPDFDDKALDLAIESYATRERRFGMISEQVVAQGEE